MSIFNDIHKNGARQRQQPHQAEAAEEATPAVIPFPDPPAAEVYHGTAGEIVRLIEPHTEADPVGLLVTLLTMFGNAVGRSPHAMIEASRHGTNEFALTVGESASARKGTALAHIRRLFEHADPRWMNERLVNGLASGQGIIHHVRDPNGEEDAGVTDKRLMIVETEFSSVLRVASGRENTLSPTLRCCWDGTTLQNLTHSERCTKPHVSIVAHITSDELRRDVTDRELYSGLLNRFIVVAVRRSKMLPFGGRVPPGDVERCIQLLTSALGFAKEIGEIVLSQEAANLWSELYPELTEMPPGPIGSQLARGAPHVRRLAMLYAAMDRSDTVTDSHLVAGATLWDYSKRSIEYLFGDGEGDSLSREIQELLQSAGEVGLTRSAIHKGLGGHAKGNDLTKALQVLEKGRRVRREAIPAPERGGRAGERWFLVEGGAR